jgi:hypothetical protein
MSNKVTNLNKIRAAARTENPERSVLLFDYYTEDVSETTGKWEQRPLVRVLPESLRRSKSGDWVFNGVNLYRVGNSGGENRATRTYRVDNINGIVRRP